MQSLRHYVPGHMERRPEHKAGSTIHNEVATLATPNRRYHLRGKLEALLGIDLCVIRRSGKGTSCRLFFSSSVHLVKLGFKRWTKAIAEHRVCLGRICHNPNLRYIAHRVCQILVKAIRHRHEVDGLYLRELCIGLGETQ